MYKFSKISMQRLETCVKIHQRLWRKVINKQEMDLFIACGWRGERDQNKAVLEGKSKVSWPNSRHNLYPSMAVDVCPYPERWSSIEAFERLEKLVWECWAEMPEDVRNEYTLVSGHDWDGDGDYTDQTFIDWPHWELQERAS